MSCALIVSTSEKGKSFFSDLIKTVGISNTVTVGSGSEARRILNRTEFDLVVINAPLSDEFGHELAIAISKNYNTGVLLVVKNDIADAGYAFDVIDTALIGTNPDEVNEKLSDKFSIINGVLYDTGNDEQEKQWAEQLEISILN